MGILSKLFGKKDQPQESKPSGTPMQSSGGGSSDPSSSVEVTPKISFEFHTEQPKPEIPELQGDYAKAVFLNAYAKASPIKAQGAYQGYLLYECGIRDCPAYHRSLVDEGLLAESSVADIVKAQKAADLKPILAEIGQPVSGKKDALVDRLLENADETFIRSKFPTRTFAISEKGQEFLNEHSAYVKLHQHLSWGISWQEFDANKRPGYSDNDIIWGILNKRIGTTTSFGRTEYLSMYQLLVEEGKRKDAIAMLLRIIYIDVSGVEGLDAMGLYKTGSITLKEAKDFFSVAVMLAPGLVNDIDEYADVYEDSMVDCIFEWHLPINLCSKANFLEMVHSCMDGSFDEEKFMGKLKRAYNKALGELRQN